MYPKGGTTEGSRSFAIAQDDINLNIFPEQCSMHKCVESIDLFK